MTTNANAFAGNPAVIGLKAVRPVALRPRLLPGLPSGEEELIACSRSRQLSARTDVCMQRLSGGLISAARLLVAARSRAISCQRSHFAQLAAAAARECVFVEPLAAAQATQVTKGELCELCAGSRDPSAAEDAAAS